MTSQEAAVVDAACNYIAISETLNVDSPKYLWEVAARRREALAKAVFRMEGKLHE